MADEGRGSTATSEPPRRERAQRTGRQRQGLAVAGFAVALCMAGAGLAAGALRSPQPLATPRLGPEVPATTMDLAINEANNSPVLVTHPTEPRFVALANRLDGPDFSCSLQVSGDSGQSWASPQGAPTLPAGAEKCYAPEIAFDARGRLFGSPDEDVGHAAPSSAARSCGSLRSIGPAASMTRARAASAEWKP